MLFIYIDESGNPGVDHTQHFFVLSALIAHTDCCVDLQEGLDRLKQELHLPREVEIKGRDIEQSKKLFSRLTLEAKREIVKRLFELLYRHNLQLLAVVFSKEEETVQRLKMSSDQIYHICYAEMLRHIEEFLEAANETALLLIDSRASSIHSSLKDDRLIEMHRAYLQEPARAGKRTRIIEYPVFVQSPFFPAIQLVDLCAYHIFRALQLRFGTEYVQARRAGVAEAMPPIPHAQFSDKSFLSSLFTHPDVDLPALASFLEFRGKVVKLP